MTDLMPSFSGVETRTSSPVKMPRDEHFESNGGRSLTMR